MYNVQLIESDSLMKVTIRAHINISGLQKMLNEIERSREYFAEGYKLWLVLPASLRKINWCVARRIDLTIYSGKARGLKQVVIEVGQIHPSIDSTVKLLYGIYRSMDIHVDLAYNVVEARKSLGLLWRRAK
jgi:hypothetical protein